MKTFSLLVLFLIIISSCSQQEEVVVQEKQSKDELVTVLESFNDSILSTKVQSRGFLGFLCVSAADIAGAWELGKIGASIGSCFPGYGTAIGGTLGAVVGGVGASYGAYCGCTMVKFPDNNIGYISQVYCDIKKSADLEVHLDKKVAINIPKEYKTAVNVGVQHNLILDAVKNNRVILTKSSGNGTSLTEQEEKILNSPEFVGKYNSLIPKYYSLDIVKYISDNSIDAMVVKLFIEVYNQYSENIDDVNLIINEYIERIENSSSLSDDEKQLVYNGLAVAAYSFQYWNSEK